MAPKKGKSINFDTMVKLFLQHYNIPTRNDINTLTAKIDRLEALIKKSTRFSGKTGRVYSVKSRGRLNENASDAVLDVVKKAKNGINFSGIQTKTGFDDKKLRNIIFRLNKLGRIRRMSRGKYGPPADKK